MAGQRQSGCTFIRPLGRARHRCVGEHLRQRRGLDPGGPDLGPRGIARRLRPGLRVDAVGVDAGDDRAGMHLDSIFSSSFFAFADSCSPNVARSSLPPSNGDLTDTAGSMLPEVAVQRAPRSSAIWPAISTPVGPPPTTTKVSSACASLRVALALGQLEGAEDPPRFASASSIDFIPGAYSANRRGRSRTGRARRRRSGCRTEARRSPVRPTESLRRARSMSSPPPARGHVARGAEHVASAGR